MYTEIPWAPYVFIPSDRGEIKSIYGQPAVKRSFGTYMDYYVWCKNKKELFENNVKPEIQFLAERYYGIPDDEFEVPRLKTYFIDIELELTQGFGNTVDVKDPINLISIHDSMQKKTVTFGLRKYTGEKYKKSEYVRYIHCETEELLLKRFFAYMHKFPCDVISGWSIYSFDLPYLVNRCKKVFGERTDIYHSMSPVNEVRIWETNDKKIKYNMDIAGVTILDYLDLYKWYSPDKLERYSLDYVCNHELEKGKLDYSEYKDLKELCEKNWNLFVEYNIIDALRVSQLDIKLDYIRLVQALSLLCKAPMKFYNVMTQLIEGLLLTHFRRKHLCAPRFAGGIQQPFEAAFVKEPVKGRHDWVIDLDIASSYPTAIITLNMSPETYYGRIIDLTEDNVIQFVKQRKFPSFYLVRNDGEKVKFEGAKLEAFNSSLDRRLMSIAPCGSVFSTKKIGVMSEIERYVFEKRVDVKSKMIRIKKTMPDLRGENLDNAKEKTAQFQSLQNALKIILNALFGVTSVPYSRYFNVNLSEAITSCGRQTIKAGEKIVNELLNKPNQELLDLIEDIKRNG